MFLVVLRYPVPAALKPHRDAHRAFVQRNAECGRILVSGPMEPRDNGGVMIALLHTRHELDAMTAEDPYFAAGVATYDVTEFHAVFGCATFALDGQPSA